MKMHKISEAEKEAKRFLERVKRLKSQISYNQITPQGMMFGCKETAAVRRASMDLTRALAEMRKP